MLKSPLRIFVPHASALPTNFMPHGDGLLAYRYITELADRGHQVTVVIEGSAIRGEIPANITLIKANGTTGNKRLTFMREMRKIFFDLHARRPFDIIHQLNPVFSGISLGLIGRNIPLVLGPFVTSWGYERPRIGRYVVNRTLRFIEGSQADVLILAGDQARSNTTYPFVKKRVIPYGIDTDIFHPQPLPSSARPTIIYLGPLAKRKGIIVLVHALNIVRERLPNVLLRIAGAGEDADEMLGLIESYGLQASVEILGSLARAQIPGYIASGHLLCQPSIGEPYGMSVIEAIASGRPVVATAAGGFLDTVDARGGILVPPYDVAALADALCNVLGDNDLAESMGAFNARLAEEYSWQTVIGKVERLYAESIADKNIEAAGKQN